MGTRGHPTLSILQSQPASRRVWLFALCPRAAPTWPCMACRLLFPWDVRTCNNTLRSISSVRCHVFRHSHKPRKSPFLLHGINRRQQKHWPLTNGAGVSSPAASGASALLSPFSVLALDPTCLLLGTLLGRAASALQTAPHLFSSALPETREVG